MNKKILDAVLAGMFCICLIAAANIEERRNGQQVQETQVTEQEITVAKRNYEVAAGVSETLSEYSFTTESDEKTGIEKNQVVLVTTPEGEVRDMVVTQDENEEQQIIEEPKNRWGITLTAEETELLARIVWLEAAGEPKEGQKAVVEVVFNRMASDKYPNTLYEVLSQKNPVQFCSWKNREIAEPTEKEYQSIQEVLDGNTSILRNDTLYFSTEPLTPHLDQRIGGHSFCY